MVQRLFLLDFPGRIADQALFMLDLIQSPLLQNHTRLLSKSSGNLSLRDETLKLIL